MATEKTTPKVPEKRAEKRKLLILSVLDLLKKHTDAEHRYRQQQIIDRLLSDYHLHVTRKSLRAELADLQEAGYPVVFAKGWYYEHEFTPAELDLVIDSLMCSAHLTDEQRTALMGKVASLGGDWYDPPKTVKNDAEDSSELQELLVTLRHAIREGVMVSFRYGAYDVDKKLHPLRHAETDRNILFRVYPDRVLTSDGMYYLVCQEEGTDSLSVFRVDRMLGLRELKRKSELSDALAGQPIELPRLGKAPLAYNGKARKQRILVPRESVHEIVEWFGKSSTFSDVTEETAVAQVMADPESVKAWMEHYGEKAELL